MSPDSAGHGLPKLSSQRIGHVETVFANVWAGDRRVLQLAKVRQQGQRCRRRVGGTGSPRAACVPVRHVLLGRATGGPLYAQTILSTFPPQRL